MEQRKKKILIVDDDLIIAKNEEIILKKSGFDAISINSGEKAISLIKNDKDIDLILMDIDLGVNCIDGTKAAEEILKIKDIPVIFISSHTETEIVEKTEKITSYGYIVKNSGPTVLTTSVKMAFRLYEEKNRVKHELYEKEKKEQALKDEYNRLLEINKVLSSLNTDYNKNINYLTTLCGKLLNATCALYNKLEEGYLYSYGMWHIPSDYNPKDCADGHICYDVIRSNKKDPVIIRSLQNTHYAKTDPNVLKYNLQTYIGVPVFLDNIPIGSLCVVYQSDFEPDKEDLITINIIGSAISVVENLKKYTNKQEELTNFFSTSLYSIGEGIIITDRDGKIEFMNNTSQKLCGFSEEEAKGKNLTEVFNIINSNTREKVENPIKKVIEEGKISKLANDTILISKDGNEYNIMDSVSPFYDKNGKIIRVIIVFRDISKEYFLINRIRENEFQYRILFNNMQIAFAYHKMFYDNDGKPVDYKFIKVNKAFEEITGLKSEDIIGKTVKEILPETEKYWIDTYGEVCKTGNPIKYQNYSKELGRYYDVYAFSPEKDHFAVFFNDITELKCIEEKLKKQIEEKETLLKEAHHRIKNNISNIASILSLQYNNTENIEVKNILEQSISQIQTMKMLYEELLLTSYDRMVYIKSYIQKIVYYNLELIGDKSIKVDINITDFKIDSKKAGYIGIIINELLTNSLKHAFLNKDDKYIYISVEKIDNNIKILVKDNGIGFTKKNNSSGIGIMIIRILAEQLDAKFQIIEDNGITSIFEFKIDS